MTLAANAKNAKFCQAKRTIDKPSFRALGSFFDSMHNTNWEEYRRIVNVKNVRPAQHFKQLEDGSIVLSADPSSEVQGTSQIQREISQNTGDR